MITFTSIIRNGSPQYTDRQKENMLAFFQRHEGQTVYLMLDENRPPRSLQQNAYYHGVVVHYLSDYTGDTPEKMHENLKEMFLPRFFNEKGEQLEKSTTRLTSKEFKDYIEQCRALAAEYGVHIPDPQ